MRPHLIEPNARTVRRTAPLKKKSPLSSEELLAKLGNIQVYEVEFNGKPYQVEVEILADEPEHVQVIVSVDDGSLPALLVPAVDIFVRAKRPRQRARMKRSRL